MRWNILAGLDVGCSSILGRFDIALSGEPYFRGKLPGGTCFLSVEGAVGGCTAVGSA
jgi:hypothetical protein